MPPAGAPCAGRPRGPASSTGRPCATSQATARQRRPRATLRDDLRPEDRHLGVLYGWSSGRPETVRGARRPERRAPAPPAGEEGGVDWAGRLYVADREAQALVLLDPIGTCWIRATSRCSAPGLAIDASDTLWVGADGSAGSALAARTRARCRRVPTRWRAGAPPARADAWPRHGEPLGGTSSWPTARERATPSCRMCSESRSSATRQGDAPRGSRSPRTRRPPGARAPRGTVRGDDQPGRLDGQRGVRISGPLDGPFRQRSRPSP